MNTIVLIIYGILMAGFLFGAAWALRHTLRFSYISSNFKKTAWVFGIVAVVIIIFSIYLLISYYRSSPSSAPLFPTMSTTKINY